MTSIPGIIIILGSPNSKKGELYSVAKQRCEKGIQEYLIERGITPVVIVDSVMSTNTLEDASLTKPIMVKYNVDDILVVTSDFHYDRAQYIFEREYSGSKIRISFSLCITDESTCGFDLKSQKIHEKNSLRKLQGLSD